MNKQVYEEISETLYTEKMDNGLTVFLLPRSEMAKTYGLFTTNYGSIDQTFTPIGSNEAVTVPEGVAHFLEHKLFEKKDRDVFADFGKQGASPNAYTSFTKTAYLFSATNHIDKNVETLLDFVQDPYFSEESVEKEKGIIAQEIKMYDDQPDWQSFMGTIKSMFKEHPVNIDIAGTVDSIYTITKDDLYTCYNTFYHPENMVFFLAGNFDPTSMMELIKTNQNAKSFQKMDEIKRQFPEEKLEVASENSEQTMSVSVPKCTIGIKDTVSTLSEQEFLKRELLQSMVLDHYFSKGGDFYQELYQSELIDDSFFYETNLERNFGYTLIGSNTHKPEAFAKKVKEMLLSTRDIGLEKEDFNRMKKKKIGQLLRSMNSLEFIASKYTHYHMLGIDFFNLIPEIQAFKLEDAHAFLNEWISDEQMTTHVITNE
ncbi:EF-P 5-aminopentanol modification-associated protein YfmH [Oceanobacillus manasiensis]|uniref:EF-P 5-aminopentanol modification-associated protein YfmH n=1 Tax=Oceanobacillus manasiensis TaxID=586413 RepID=UPI0005A6642A|nr:pitrilysin family protein [Oceanobacillus manasiensis]